MKLYTFETRGQRHLGAEWLGQLADLKAAHSAMIDARRLRPGLRAALPADMLAFIRAGEAALRAARDTLEFMAGRPAVPVGETLLYPFEAVKLLAPVPRPGKILCAELSGEDSEGCPVAVKGLPVFHAKMPSSVIGPHEAIVLPAGAGVVECGAQLAVVIGQRLKDAPADQVMSGVLGWSILSDVRARTVDAAATQPVLSRNHDTFCPLGPGLLTAEEVNVPGEAQLSTFLNLEPRQTSRLRDWLPDLPGLLSRLSHRLTLEPGDVIGLGAPASSAPGQACLLQAGDRVRLEIDGLGALENPVV